MTESEFRTLFARHIQEDTARFEKISVDMWWIKWLVVGLVNGIGLIVIGILIALGAKLI